MRIVFCSILLGLKDVYGNPFAFFKMFSIIKLIDVK